MKTKPLVRTLTTHLALSLGPAITASSLFGPQFARAATQTYDDTSAFNIWDASTLNWSNSTSAWTNGNNAIFGGTGKSVTVNAATTVGDITFNSTGYTIADGTGSLTLANTTNTFSVGSGLSATISEGIAGTGGIIKTGAGTLRIRTSQATLDTHTGPTIVNGGTLEPYQTPGNNHAGGAQIDNTSSITMNAGTALNIISSSSVNGSYTRATALTPNGATVLHPLNSIDGNNRDMFSGALTIGAGANVRTSVNANAGPRNLTLTFASQSRSAGSTMFYQGDSFGTSASSAAIFTTATSLTNGVLDGSFESASSTTDATDISGYTGGRVRSVATTAAGAGNFTGIATTNCKFTGAATLSADQSTNSVNLGAGSSINGAQKLTVTSGMILATDNSNLESTAAGTLDFGAAEGMVYVDGLTGSVKTLTIGSAITGSSGFTFTGGLNGAGTLVLSAANSFMGPLTLNNGILHLNLSTALLSGTSLYFHTGSILNLNFSSSEQQSIAGLYLDGVSLGSGTFGAGTYGGLTITGTGFLAVAATPSPQLTQLCSG